jgi:hypothetical protein
VLVVFGHTWLVIRAAQKVLSTLPLSTRLPLSSYLPLPYVDDADLSVWAHAYLAGSRLECSATAGSVG